MSEIKDRIVYFTSNGYLKFPHLFKRKFGMGTGRKLNDLFPNPSVSIDENKNEFKIIYTFSKESLTKWSKSKDTVGK